MTACRLELCVAHSDMHCRQLAAAAQCMQAHVSSRQVQWMLHLPAVNVLLQPLSGSNSLSTSRL